jgi:LysR family transcriptional regulator for bpeEF and oprC
VVKSVFTLLKAPTAANAAAQHSSVSLSGLGQFTYDDCLEQTGGREMDRFRAMEVYVKTVEAGSLSRAASQLGLANASVTTLLRALESHLGVTLLQRSTRYLRLTDEGADYYRRCKSILAEVEEAEASAAEARGGLTGTLRLETPIAVGHTVFAPALASFARSHPGLRVFTCLDNGVENLIKRGVDVAIRMDEVEDGDLVARPIFSARYALCASPAFLTEHGIPASPGDINPQHCLGFADYPRSDGNSWIFCREGEEVLVRPGGNLFFNSSDALIGSALRGAGMIYVLDVLAARHLRRGELVKLLPEWETGSRQFFAAYLKTSFIPAKIRALVTFLPGVLAAAAAGEEA